MILDFSKYLEQLNEGIIRTYDIDFVIDKSLQRLSVLNVKYDIVKNPNNTIKLTIYDFNKIIINHLFGLLNKNFTNLFGWFPTYMFLTNLSGMKNSMNYDENYLVKTYEYLGEVSILYESKFDLISDMPPKLYHISIQEHSNKILSIGIVPKTKNKISSHGNRIYVCSSLNDCIDLIDNMKFYFFNKNEKINTKWIIYEIDTSDLDILLYKDPNYPDRGYYLLGNIPPKNLTIALKEN